MKKLGLIAIAAAFLGLGCSGEKPFSQIEATDEEAIFNVFFSDYPRLTALDLPKVVQVDTQSYIDNPDPDRPIYWHQVAYTDEDLNIAILDNPVPSPIGLVNQANISYAVLDTGYFWMMRFNVAADSMERFSQRFSMRASRTAVCQQWGQPNQSRRGWLLIEISDARYSSTGQSYHFLQNFGYSSVSHPDTNFVYASHELSELLSFHPSESVHVSYDLIDSLDIVLAFVSQGDFGYQLALPERDSADIYNLDFAQPSKKIYGQLLFLVVNVGDFDAPYRANGFSYNYRIR